MGEGNEMYFTIVIAIDTIQIDKLKEFICELQSTSYYRSNLLEIIVIDTLNVRALEDFLKRMDNICYHKFESKNLASIYNFSLDKISGKYINFTKASAYYSARSLKEVDKIFQHSDAGCVCMLPYTQTSDGKKTQYHHLNRKKSHHNIYLKPDENNLCLGSYFIAINKFKHFVFDEILYDEALYKYIINVLVIAGKYYSVSCEYIMSNSNEDLFCESLLSFEKRWYNDSLSNFIMPLILSYPQTLFVQNIILYFLSCKMAANQDQFDKKILNDEEIEIFLATIREILLKIDDSVIENFSYPNVPDRYKNIFYSLKYNTYEYSPTFNGTAFVKNYPLFRVNEYYVYIMSMDYCSSEESLHIDCKIDCKELFSNDESDARIEIELDNVSYKTETNNVYSHIKIFGKKMHQSYTFDANIDISYIDNSSKLCFYYCVGNYRQKMHIRFRAKSPARLNKKYKSYYWRFKDDAIIYYDHGVGGLGFKQVNRFYIFKRELLLYREFIQKCNSKKLIFKVIALRGLYWLTKPYYKNKKIWITFDKLYKAGDNGEYFFNYCRSQKSRFDCFYIINQTANDYSRLKGNKGVLRFKSIRQYLTSLNCEIMFSTHANPYSFNGFSKRNEIYFRDLFKFDNFCLQHGLTIQEIANIQNRVFDNTKLYFCASKYEIKNLMQDEYDYCRFDYLRLTGSPRYDKLLDQANRTILIAPTWRNNAANHKTKTG